MPDKHQAETLSIEGPDAIAFAQSQFSSNVAELAIGRWQFSAWLDAQGRVRALFHLARLDEHHLLLVLRGGQAAPLADDLRRFVFRAKAKVSAVPTRALGRAEPMELHAVEQRDDGIVLGCGTHALSIGANENDDWRAEHIRLGWPWLPDQALDALLPPALSLERLEAVAFDKGCYPGQEIAARLHYRGGHKRHMHSVVLSRPVPAGNVLREEQQDVALVLDCKHIDADHAALVIVSDAAAEGAQKRVLSWNGDAVEMEFRKRWPE